eukprot:2150379-Rhodomonas_salina.1
MALCQLAPPSLAAEVPYPKFLRLEYTRTGPWSIVGVCLVQAFVPLAFQKVTPPCESRQQSDTRP